MTGILLLMGLFTSVFFAAEALYRRGCAAENTRKFVHIGAGIVSCLLPVCVSRLTAIGIGVVFFFFLLWAWRARRLKSIHNVKENDVGAMFFPLGLIPCAVWFWDNALAFQSSALILGFSDGFACIFGRRYGKRGYSITGYKTIEGSLAFFLTTIIVLMAACFFYGATISIARVGILFFGSLALTAVEGTLGHGWDNIFIPVSAGVVTRMVLGG